MLQRAKTRGRDSIATRSPAPPARANPSLGGLSVTNRRPGSVARRGRRFIPNIFVVPRASMRNRPVHSSSSSARIWARSSLAYGRPSWSVSYPACPGGGRVQEPCTLTVKPRVRDRDWIFPLRSDDPRDIRVAACLDVPICVLHRMLRCERIRHHRVHPTSEPASDFVRSPALNLPPRCSPAASPHGAWDRPFSGGPPLP